MRIYFTPQQADLLVDRLLDPNAVGVSLEIDTPEGWDAIHDRCDGMRSSLRAARFISAPLSDLEKRVLHDCLEHSTYLTFRGGAAVAARIAKKIEQTPVLS